LSEPIGIINNGRKKIDGLDKSNLVCDFVDTCVFKTFNAYKDIFVSGNINTAEYIRQVTRTYF